MRLLPRVGRARLIDRFSTGWILNFEWLDRIVELKLIRRLKRPTGDR